jgi:hypothetical protein
MNCFSSKTKKVPMNELRPLILTSFSNTINVKNEGIKHGSYDRYLLKRKKQQFVYSMDNKNILQCKIDNIK